MRGEEDRVDEVMSFLRELLVARKHADIDGDGDLDLLTNGTWFENIGDNCPSVSNADQADTDEDGIGDACE